MTRLEESKVLVVDDDPCVLVALSEELAEHYAVTSVCSGQDALTALERSHYHAVISDVRMPEMSGVELVRQVRSNYPDIVRILLTGYADDHATEAAVARDGAYKLSKPWGAELEITLRRALEHQAQIRAARDAFDRERIARERAELAVSQLDKMASLGTLAAGVAHELRTPLTYLRANFEWLSRELTRMVGTGSEIQDVCSECSGGVERLVDILESLRDYSSPRTARVGTVDVGGCIQSAIRLVSCTYRHGIQFKFDAPVPPLWVRGNDGELGQIFINLLVNAVQAMGGDGTVSISTRAVGQNVAVEVEDSGPGVPPEVIPRLFDTFFTTKQEQKGNGLGLAISRQIAKSHGGTLRYESRSGCGATFVLELPRTHAEGSGE